MSEQSLSKNDHHYYHGLKDDERKSESIDIHIKTLVVVSKKCIRLEYLPVFLTLLCFALMSPPLTFT